MTESLAHLVDLDNVTALSQMLFNDIFDDAGYSLIVTKEGEIIAYDGEPSYHKITYGDNFFVFIKTEHFCPKILL